MLGLIQIDSPVTWTDEDGDPRMGVVQCVSDDGSWADVEDDITGDVIQLPTSLLTALD